MGRSVVTFSFKRVYIERQNVSSFSNENKLIILAEIVSGENAAMLFRSGATT